MSDSIFERGLAIEIKDHVDKKGQFDYLSWPFAVRELRRLDPRASWTVSSFTVEARDENGIIVNTRYPYMKTKFGAFVEVIVHLSDDTSFTQIHPVLDNRNQTLKDPNAFQVNTSIQRCLVKAIALATGIGLSLYAGEDLPPDEEGAKPNHVKEVLNTFEGSEIVPDPVQFKELLKNAKTPELARELFGQYWPRVKVLDMPPKDMKWFEKWYNDNVKK